MNKFLIASAFLIITPVGALATYEISKKLTDNTNSGIEKNPERESEDEASKKSPEANQVTTAPTEPKESILATNLIN